MTSWLRRWAPPVLIHTACVVGLVALGMMAFSLLVPRALPVILALSVGQALGVWAFLAYLVAILTVVREHDRPSDAAARESRARDRPTAK